MVLWKRPKEDHRQLALARNVWWMEERRWTVTCTKTERRPQTSSVNTWSCRLYNKRRYYLEEDRKRTADVYRQQVTSGGGLYSILRGDVTWTKTERGPQTSSINRWRLVVICKVYWEEMLPGRRPKEDRRRLASTGDVWWWIVQYIETRCYLDEDWKRTADV